MNDRPLCQVLGVFLPIPGIRGNGVGMLRIVTRHGGGGGAAGMMTTSGATAPGIPPQQQAMPMPSHMADLSRFIPTPAQMEAFAAGFQQVGRAAQDAADNIVEAFAAAGRHLEQERSERAEAAFTRAFPTDSLMAPLLASIAQRELAKAYSRQPPAWRPLTCRTDPTHFGRKRRARRARGRRIEARQALAPGHWFPVNLDPSRPNLLELARKIHVPVFDEIDRFPVMTDEQAQAYLDSHREQRRMITLNLGQAYGKSKALRQQLEGSGTLTVEQWAAARRTMSRQQEAQADG